MLLFAFLVGVSTCSFHLRLSWIMTLNVEYTDEELNTVTNYTCTATHLVHFDGGVCDCTS